MTDRAKRADQRGRVSRRDLLKLLPAAGAVAAGAALLTPRTAATHVVSGTCRACLARCGIRATLRGERVVRVEGDPASGTAGFICLHGLAIREIVHSPTRVRRPLKKVGNSLEEVSWEQALEEIAERLVAVRDEYGPQALAVQAGWGLVAHPLQGFLLRLCQAFGTPNFATVESLCQSSLRMGELLTAGSRCNADANRSNTVVVWGANPTVSHPPFARVVTAATWPGRNLLVIDPVQTEAAARATLHLQIRPGTDGALALGLMHVLVREGLYDRAYVERYTVGFDRLRGRIARYDPARVSRITSIPQDLIRHAARMIARDGPTSFWTGLGVEHHENGVQSVRAITVLAALCGDVGVRGGSKLMLSPRMRSDGKPLPCMLRMTTPRPVPPPVEVPPIGFDEYPLFELFNRQAQGNLFARAILEDKPYPLRALILFASNALTTSPGSERLRRAADKLSLLVSVDPFLTDSGKLADYVLPAATFAEGTPPMQRDDRVVDGPVIAEQYESRTDWDILTGLAAALGFDEYFPWPTLEQAQRAAHEPFMPARRDLIAEHLNGTSSGSPSFPTASGKLEIYSPTLERFGYDPLPDWTQPSQRPEPGPGAFPLILVSGPRTRAYIGSQFRQIPSVAAKNPRPLAEVHPSTARSIGIEDGAPIAVVSPHGRIELHAKVTARVHPDCVVVPAGWSEANANFLTDDRVLDPVSGFPAFRSGVCRVEPRPVDVGTGFVESTPATSS